MSPALDPAASFATLVAGSANHLAIAAARALAESARPPFNPLYLLGAVGQGKSHLLHAIGAHRRSVAPHAEVRCLTWDELDAELRAARLHGRAEEARRALAHVDLLLLDDLDRLRPAAEGGAELVAVLEERLLQRRPTALAATVPPGELLGPDDPMGRLLGGGLVVELGAPDAALREAIIRQRAADAGVSFASAVVAEVVQLPLDSVRDLVSAVGRLVAFQAVSPTPLDPSQARVLITGVLEEEPAGAAAGGDLPAEPSERPPPPLRASGERPDEFASFLSEIVAGITDQVDRWRSRVGDAILRWEAEGFHTGRLQALLDQELPAQPETVLQRFEVDIAALRRLASEIAELAPALAAHEALRDPDQLAVAEHLLEQARTRGLAAHQPAEQLRVETLLEGPSNRAALQAVADVTASPGQVHTPLVVVGESGTGKTHLLHALGNALADAGLLGVVCLGAQALSAEVEAAQRQGRLVEWQRQFEWCGALLVDDVHLLAGHPAAQEVLLAMLDHLLPQARQVAVTSAVPLFEMAGLSPQLLARLAAGTVVELPRPDRDIRRGLVRRLLADAAVGEDPAVTEFVAERPAESLRAVQATVQRLLRAAEHRGVALSLALTRETLELAAVSRGPRPSLGRPGVLGPTVGGARLREKLVETWPVAGDGLIEELG